MGIITGTEAYIWQRKHLYVTSLLPLKRGKFLKRLHLKLFWRCCTSSIYALVNILIEFKNTIRLSADSLIALADALIVFLQNCPSPRCLLCERKDNYCRWRYMGLVFCSMIIVANFPT